MKPLNFPNYDFRFKKDSEGTIFIFDLIRKKWLVLTPEEWVRQHWVCYLTIDLKVPIANISVESGIKVIARQKRTDLIVYKNSVPILLLECKAPEIKINQKVLNQIVNYNRVHKVKFLVLSNGLEHLHFQINYQESEIVPMKNLLEFIHW